MTAPDTLPPELEELGALLREDPPRPDPTWARELDSRAAAGFARPPRKRPAARLKPRREWFLPAAGLTAAAAVAVIVVIGASTPGNMGDGDSGASGGGGSSAAPMPGTRARAARVPARAVAQRGQRRLDQPRAAEGRTADVRRRQPRLRLAHRAQAGAQRLDDAGHPAARDRGRGRRHRACYRRGGWLRGLLVAAGGEGGMFELRIPTTGCRVARRAVGARPRPRSDPGQPRHYRRIRVGRGRLCEARNECGRMSLRAC